jgi:hypothetical protein
LPAAFYTFALQAHPAIQYPVRVRATDGLEMLGYTITRRETVNLRMPDVVLTTYWRADRPVPAETSLPSAVTNEQGDFHTLYGENAAALDWYPTALWKPGQVVAVTTVNMGIAATLPGTARACLGVFAGHRLRFSPPAGLGLRIEQSSGASGWVRLEANGHTLCVGAMPIIF